MDIFGLVFNTVYTDLIWFGVVLFLLGLLALFVHPHRVVKTAGLVFAVIGILLVAGAFMGAAATQPAPATIATPTAQVQITNIGGLTGATMLNSTGNLLQVAATSNFTTVSVPTSGVVSFHFDLMRTDTLTTSAVFAINMNNPSVYNSTKATTYTYIAQYSSNKTNEITIDKTIGGTALVSIPSASFVQVNVSFTLNAPALGSTALYNTIPLSLDVSNNGISVASIGINLVEASR